jgi:hypothetical protein
MSRLFPALLLALSLAASVSATHKTTATAAHSTKKASKSKCQSCPRDAHGKIKRSPEAKKQYMKQSGYPHGRKGYVVDHIVPLACGGADSPSNMMWQTKAEAAAKDKIERKGCTQ